MTREELIAFGQSRHGDHWIGPLADEIGYSFSQLWRVAAGESGVSRRLELEIEQLKQNQA